MFEVFISFQGFLYLTYLQKILSVDGISVNVFVFDGIENLLGFFNFVGPEGNGHKGVKSKNSWFGFRVLLHLLYQNVGFVEFSVFLVNFHEDGAQNSIGVLNGVEKNFCLFIFALFDHLVEDFSVLHEDFVSVWVFLEFFQVFFIGLGNFLG